MALQEGEGVERLLREVTYIQKGIAKERRWFRYFYINGQLHKMLHVIRARDECIAWCYQEHRRKIYQWSDVKKRGSRGFTIGEVSKIVHRTRRMIRYYYERGLMEWPEQTYSLETGRKGMSIFSEEDVYNIQRIMSYQHRGRPRNDGLNYPRDVLSKQEIYAQVKHDIVLYAKNKDGEFVPLYAAEEW